MAFPRAGGTRILQRASDGGLNVATGWNGEPVDERKEPGLGESVVELFSHTQAVISLVADEDPPAAVFDAEFLKEQSCESWHIVVVPPSAVDRMEGRGRVVDVVSKVFDERDDDEPVLRCSCDPLDEVRVLGTRFAA